MFFNPNRFGAKAKEFFSNLECDVLAMAEHHVPNPLLDENSRWFRARKRASYWSPAEPSSESQARGLLESELNLGSTTGGVSLHPMLRLATSHLVETKRGLHSTLEVDDDHWVAMAWHVNGLSLVVISLYLICGLGVKDRNLSTLTELGAWLLALNLPWLIVGDFNVEPRELLASNCPQQVRGKIWTPLDTAYTCNASKEGSLIDYVVAAETLSPFIDCVLPCEEVPWGPHIGLRVKLNRQPKSVYLRVLKQAAPLPLPAPPPRQRKKLADVNPAASTRIDPARTLEKDSWGRASELADCFVAQQHIGNSSFKIAGFVLAHRQEQLDQHDFSFITQMEVYLATAFKLPGRVARYIGRGAMPRTMRVKAVDKIGQGHGAAPRTWKAEAANWWSTVATTAAQLATSAAGLAIDSPAHSRGQAQRDRALERAAALAASQPRYVIAAPDGDDPAAEWEEQ